MDNCIKCGKELEAHNPVCPHCGFRNILEGYSSFHSENVMVLIEGGTFRMGSDSGLETEKPEHQVTVSSFYLNKYTVTQKEWYEIMLSNPSEVEGDYFPVENISWYDAIEYCNRKSIKDCLTPCYTINGKDVICNFDSNGYRLPTEAEWEFAMRGGNKTENYHHSGSDDIHEVAWFIENSEFSSHPIGTKKPNELGLYDMSGNVYEWCWDRFDFYTSEEKVNPKGPETGENRVFRGGSWSSKKEYCTVANRYYNQAEKNVFNIGLRLAKSSN
ncbi:MAG TPA: formylglycine-generating enzyme family protein [Candidatus Cloacimonadota bacterium]|nr:formylglycine-generating enzyme family protein [Candidatus Cloacimonadota bacterium]